jgi:phosphoribosylaminoimidazole-succinocarboxamide synthase
VAPKSKKPKKQKLLIKGRCADIYATSEEDRLLLEFKDDIVSFDGKRKTRMQNKRKQACIFTSRLFDYLKKYNVPNYFVENSGENAIFINNIDLIPIQIVIRNEVSRNLSKTLGIKEGGPDQRTGG